MTVMADEETRLELEPARLNERRAWLGVVGQNV